MSFIRFDLSWLSPPDSESGADRPLLELLAGVRAPGSRARAARAGRPPHPPAGGGAARGGPAPPQAAGTDPGPSVGGTGSRVRGFAGQGGTGAAYRREP